MPAKEVTAPGAAKPDGLAAVALDFMSPPMHIVVPRTTWPDVAAAAATQMMSPGEVSTWQPTSDIAETDETCSAVLPSAATPAEFEASPLKTQRPAAHACRAMIHYSAPLRLQCEPSTEVLSGSRGRDIPAIPLIMDASAFPRAACSLVAALGRVPTTLPRSAAAGVNALSGAIPRPPPASRHIPLPSAPRCMPSDTVSGGAALACTPSNPCTASIVRLVCVVMLAGLPSPGTRVQMYRLSLAFPLCRCVH